MSFKTQKMTGYTVDSTAFTVVVVCRNPACDWRVLVEDRAAAWRVAYEHERMVHPEETTAAKNYSRLENQNLHFQNTNIEL